MSNFYNSIEPFKGLRLVETREGNYAYNSVLGGLRRLTQEEVLCIKAILNESRECRFWSPNILNGLRASYFLRHVNDLTEYDIIKSLIKKYKRDIQRGGSITKLLLYVTQNCFLRCPYCYILDAPRGNIKNKNVAKDDFKNMPWIVAEKAIKSFFAVTVKNKQNKVHIRFHGGEPLLNFSLIKNCIEYMNNKYPEINKNYHMNTNGLLLTKEKVSFFADKNIGIEVSIDGPKEIHDKVRFFPNGKGSFSKAIKGIENLLKSGFPRKQINIATTLHIYNIYHLRQIVDLAYDLGIPAVEINTLIFKHPLDTLEDIDSRVYALTDARIYGVKRGVTVSGKWFKLFERLKDPVLNYCGRIGQQIGVDPNANIILCTGYLYNYGKIDLVDRLFKDDDYIQKAMRIVGNIGECRGCSIEGMCAGGCPASAEKCHGNFFQPERKECIFRRKITKSLLLNIDSIVGHGVDIEKVDASYIPTQSSIKGSRFFP